MKLDRNKKILNITYNHLNLPTKIEFDKDGDYQPDEKELIDYVYDATGVKLEKIVKKGSALTTTKYAGNYIYENDQLKFFSHPEGYVQPDGNENFDYIYQYKDHLGNIRLSYKDVGTTSSPVLEIVEENNYYPFGLKHKGYNNVINGTQNNHKTFQGQELEEELGKNTYAYQWRDYDPAIGRFNKIDRFAEKYRSRTPYQFAMNNPIKYQEIAGDSINIAKLRQFDKENKTTVLSDLKTSLSKITGLTFKEDGDMLIYDTDDDGNAIISTTTDDDGNTVEVGSATARGDTMGAIDHKKKTLNLNGKLTGSSSGPATRGGLFVDLNPNQINGLMDNTYNLNKETMGFGMTFLHEMHHSGIGLDVGHSEHSFGDKGAVVNRMNTIRGELGSGFGQRESYNPSYPMRVDGTLKRLIPFSTPTLNNINNGTTPSIQSGKFIGIDF